MLKKKDYEIRHFFAGLALNFVLTEGSYDTIYNTFNCWTSCSSYYISAAKIHFQFSGTKKRVKLAAGESLNNK